MCVCVRAYGVCKQVALMQEPQPKSRKSVSRSRALRVCLSCFVFVRNIGASCFIITYSHLKRLSTIYRDKNILSVQFYEDNNRNLHLNGVTPVQDDAGNVKDASKRL